MSKLEDEFIKQALSADEYAEYKKVAGRLAENSRAIPTLVVAGVPMEDWWQQAATAVAPRLEKAKVDAAKHRQEQDATRMPWVHKSSAQVMLQDIQRMQWFNDRVLLFTRQMLSKHALISTGLEQQASVVRDIIDRGQDEVGKVLMQFIRRLQNNGLQTARVKDLSNPSIQALVEALNGKHKVDLFDTLGVHRSGQSMTAEDIEAMEVEQAQFDAEAAKVLAEVAAARASPTAVEEQGPLGPPPVVKNLEDWNYEDGPLPPEWWSSAQDVPQDYRWEYRRATAEEWQKAIEMDLPKAHCWAALRQRDPRFAKESAERLRSQNGAILNVRDFFAARLGIDCEAVDDNLARSWVFLLAARPSSGQDYGAVFRPKCFDGIFIPCFDSGVGVIRQLHWVGADP